MISFLYRLFASIILWSSWRTTEIASQSLSFFIMSVSFVSSIIVRMVRSIYEYPWCSFRFLDAAGWVVSGRLIHWQIWRFFHFWLYRACLFFISLFDDLLSKKSLNNLSYLSVLSWCNKTLEISLPNHLFNTIVLLTPQTDRFNPAVSFNQSTFSASLFIFAPHRWRRKTKNQRRKPRNKHYFLRRHDPFSLRAPWSVSCWWSKWMKRDATGWRTG